MPPGGCAIESLLSKASNFLRSSAVSILSRSEPRIRTPALCKGAAKLIAVCPPNCTITPIGCSRSITFITSSKNNGSKYKRSDVLKSVDTVSGLLLIITAS
ncbi:hypothetical protein D3C85_1029890 [compost metagenome]